MGGTKALRSRRIYNELSVLSCDIDFILEKKDYIHEVTINECTDIFEFKLLKNYPFSPPILYINNVQYIELLHNYWRFFKPFYDTKSKCICESSVLCNHRWSPGFKIFDILNEIEKNKKLIKTIYKRKFVERVMNRYNIFENAIIEKTKDFIIT